MRIIETDNFGGDYPDEKFLLWPMPEEDAHIIAKAVNEAAEKCFGIHFSRYWRVVPDGYKLQPGFEP